MTELLKVLADGVDDEDLTEAANAAYAVLEARGYDFKGVAPVLREDVWPYDGVHVSEQTARVARRELELLIKDTADEDPDPLQDDIFRARDELDEVLEVTVAGETDG